MEAYSIFSRVFFILATLPFCLGLTLTRQVAYRKDLKEIKIQEKLNDPASDDSFAHSPSGFSCPCLYLRMVSLPMLKKEPLHSTAQACSPSLWSHVSWKSRHLQQNLSTVFSLNFNSSFTLQLVAWSSIFCKDLILHCIQCWSYLWDSRSYFH